MTLGKVSEVYAAVISRPALTMLLGANIIVSYGTLADNIINRAGTDICPVEKLCQNADTAQQCLPIIENFIKQMTVK
jgi:iron complex outermembrane receptor protein